MTLEAPSRAYASWIEISVEDDQPKAQMVGRGGGAHPLPKISIKDAQIEFKDYMVFTGRLVGDRIVGTAAGRDGTPWRWTAVRAPGLERNSPPEWGEPVVLFDGKDFSNWTTLNSARNSWKVEGGVMTNHPPSTHLVSRQQFKDFKLHIEFNCPRNSNSGVFLRGRYEVQIEDDSIKELPSHYMGGVYGFLAPEIEMPRRPGEWQSFDITLIGRRVSVVQNGRTIINNREIPGITGGALDSHEELPGPIYLQGDHGDVSFRNIIVIPAKE